MKNILFPLATALSMAIFGDLANADDQFYGLTSAANHATKWVHADLDDQMVDLADHPDRGERALTRMIEEVETRVGQFEPELYGYLNELGLIKQANQDHRGAIEVFQRMQTLTHWADGVYSPLQLRSLQLQSRSLVALGKLRDADRVERFHLFVAEKSARHESELIAPLWRLGDWQRASLQYRSALENYGRALRIIDDHGLADRYRIRTLHARALTEHLARKCCAYQTLRSLAELSEQITYADQLAVREARLNAADMSIIEGRSDAILLYATLEQVPAAFLGPRSVEQVMADLSRAEDPFSQATGKEVVHFKTEPSVSLGKPKKKSTTFSTGDPVRLCAQDDITVRRDSYVDVSVDVSEEGQPSNIELSGAAPNRLKRYLRTTLKRSAYRPAIENGEPQATTLTFRQHFSKAKPLNSSKVADWRGILTEHACQLVAVR